MRQQEKPWASIKGLHVLDPKGNPTQRFDVVKAGKLARLTKEEWQAERDKMINICSQCHSKSYAITQALSHKKI